MKCYEKNMKHVHERCADCGVKGECHVDFDGTCIFLCKDCVEKWGKNRDNMTVVSMDDYKLAKKDVEKRQTGDCLYYNITFIIPEDRKDDLIEKLHYVEYFVGGTMSVVAGEPVKYTAKRCPQCHSLIHWMCQECTYCGQANIR